MQTWQVAYGRLFVKKLGKKPMDLLSDPVFTFDNTYYDVAGSGYFKIKQPVERS